MGIPYPKEVFGPPLEALWTAYGDSVIMPLLMWGVAALVTWAVGIIAVAIYLIIKHDISISHAHATAKQRRALRKMHEARQAADAKSIR